MSIVADGKAATTTTTAATVAKVLEDAGLTLGASDRVSQPGNAPVVNDMVIKVSRVDVSKTAEHHRSRRRSKPSPPKAPTCSRVRRR